MESIFIGSIGNQLYDVGPTKAKKHSPNKSCSNIRNAKNSLTEEKRLFLTGIDNKCDK